MIYHILILCASINIIRINLIHCFRYFISQMVHLRLTYTRMMIRGGMIVHVLFSKISTKTLRVDLMLMSYQVGTMEITPFKLQLFHLVLVVVVVKVHRMPILMQQELWQCG